MRRRDEALDGLLVLALALSLVALVMLLTACATTEAVAALPEGWWLGLERVLVALLSDLWSLLTLAF